MEFAAALLHNLKIVNLGQSEIFFIVLNEVPDNNVCQ
jgi:hypothetical protein